MFKLALTLHAFAGLFGLLVGPIAMAAKKRKGLHTLSGALYFYLMTAVCTSGALLAVLRWERNWWLFFVAIFSYWFCIRGYVAEKRRPPGWLKIHIGGMLGSYVAMTTAFVVVNVGRVESLKQVPVFLFWILPTVVALPLIKRTVLKYDR